jgi:hypothetical protein
MIALEERTTISALLERKFLRAVALMLVLTFVAALWQMGWAA